MRTRQRGTEEFIRASVRRTGGRLAPVVPHHRPVLGRHPELLLAHPHLDAARQLPAQHHLHVPVEPPQGERQLHLHLPVHPEHFIGDLPLHPQGEPVDAVPHHDPGRSADVLLLQIVF